MNKAFVVVVLLTGLAGGLTAQQNVEDYYIHDVGSTTNYSTWNDLSEALYKLVAQAQIIFPNYYIRIIGQPSRLEEQLVSKAVEELPGTTAASSTWTVDFRSYYRNRSYQVWIYCDRDGKKYYRMIRFDRRS
jgi:hypothetical protein